jgi:hypothetical protein
MTEQQHAGSVDEEKSEAQVAGAENKTNSDAGLKSDQMLGSEPRHNGGDLPGVEQTMKQKVADEEEDSIDGIDDDDETEPTAADDLAIAAASLSGIIDSAPSTVEDKNEPSRMSLKQVAAALEAPPGMIYYNLARHMSCELSMQTYLICRTLVFCLPEFFVFCQQALAYQKPQLVIPCHICFEIN